MNRIVCLFFIGLIIFGIQPLMAQEETPAAEPAIETTVSEQPTEAASDAVEPMEAAEATEPTDTVDVTEVVEPVETTKTATETAEAEQSAEAVELTAETAEEQASEATETAVSEQPADTATPAATVTEQSPAEQQEIPYRIRNNHYFRESQRYAKLAEETYTIGDYDASTGFAEEAIRYALLSDEYVALQMKIKAANDAIAAAKSRIDWAVSSGASKQYPAEFAEAEGWYDESLEARKSEEWENAIAAAHKVINILAYIEAPNDSVLPASYVVRSWATFKDCLWNIAARPWVYGNPRQWRRLYEANKSKLPEPDNADLIEPGMVIEIPSLKGEVRRGTWDGNKTYPPIR